MANKGDIQHNLKVGADTELFFNRIVTDKGSADYGKLISKTGVRKFPYQARMTGDSIRGTTEAIESNELRPGKMASKKRIGNESAEGSLDIELSPITFDDNMAAALGNDWKVWTSDNNSAINLDKEQIGDGLFLTRCTEQTVDQYGNWGADYNKNEHLGTRLLLKKVKADGTIVSGTENGLIEVPENCVVHELTCGNKDIRYDVLRKLGGNPDEDLYQDYKNISVGSMSLDIRIGSIVTGSFSFLGSNNPKRLDESNVRKEYGSNTGSRFVDSGMTGNKFIDNLPKKSTDTDQFTSLDGNLWINGKNITFAESLSVELNKNLEKKYAILVRKAIATAGRKVDITGNLKTYVVFGESEGLFNSATENDTNEILFILQDKEVNPSYLYVFQIFQSTFDPPESSGGGDSDYEDTYNLTSFGERGLRIFRIALPMVDDVEFQIESSETPVWTNKGQLVITPSVEMQGVTSPSVSIVDILKKADGTEIARQTISEVTVSDDGTSLIAEEDDFTASGTEVVTDGEIREVKITLNGNEFTKSIGKPDETAPAEVTNLTATAGNKKATAKWTDPSTSDLDHLAITVSHTSGTESVVDIYESVDRGVQVYNARGLANGTEYTVKVQTVDSTGNTSTGVTTTVTPSAS